MCRWDVVNKIKQRRVGEKEGGTGGRGRGRGGGEILPGGDGVEVDGDSIDVRVIEHPSFSRKLCTT